MSGTPSTADKLSVEKMASLPAWAREAFEDTSNPDIPRRPSDFTDEPAWQMLLEAAVVADFLPRDVAPTDNIQDRATAERILLSFADTARSGGTTRWALTRDARRDVLQAARTRGELGVAIAATKPRFEDSVSAALRNVLEGAVSSMPAGLSLQQLEALQLACTWVAGLPGIRTPPLAELDRELEMRRMFVGFARMVGRPDPGAPNLEASASKDRFFGRGAEIETLRAYVGVVRAETLGQKVGRVARRLERALIERKPLAIWGVGGVGKTTLIAKFMLEHAEAASDRFPFAYLDFDHSTISARNRSGLLAEMCLQARTQFSELSGPMTMLRERTQSLGQLLHSRPSGETIEQLTPLLREFRRLVDGFLSDRERFWEAERPFLLVFDTFELVQQGGDVRRVAEYLGPFQGWSRLRVVLSGRGKLDDFPGGVEGVADELGPLDPTGSASLLMALADDARRTLTESQARRLVEALAQALGQKRGGGVHPLALRLVGDLFVDRPGSQAPETNSVDIVDGLLAELESVGGLGVKGKLGETLVLGILVRRILGHIADERVRALADPGLVLRAITPLTIEVMARGTPKPTGDNKATDDADNTDFQPWQLEPEQAADIFNAFKLEVTLVQQDGSALRHRDDIRQIMTPLIRARRPKRFALLHHLAYEHFRARVAAELFAKDAASEAIYHALWCDEPLDTVDGLWPKGGGFDPKIDPEEFLPHRKWACAYLRAKAGATLEIDELGLLPPHVVGDWIASQASALLAENRIDASVETLRYAAKSPAFFDRNATAAANIGRVLYRAGLWDDANAFVQRELRQRSFFRAEDGHTRPSGDRAQATLSLLRTGVTLDARSGQGDYATSLARTLVDHIEDPLVRVEMRAFETLSQQSQDPAGKGVDRETAGDPKRSWSRDLRILRLAILANAQVAERLLPRYLSSGTLLPSSYRGSVGQALGLLMKIVGLSREIGLVRSLLHFAGLDKFADPIQLLGAIMHADRQTLERLIGEKPQLVAPLRTLVLNQHRDWIRPLGHALDRALQEKDKQLWSRLVREGYIRKEQMPAGTPWSGAGLDVVEQAINSARILELAQFIGENQWSSVDAAVVARSLIVWHNRLEALLARPESGSSLA